MDAIEKAFYGVVASITAGIFILTVRRNHLLQRELSDVSASLEGIKASLDKFNSDLDLANKAVGSISIEIARLDERTKANNGEK